MGIYVCMNDLKHFVSCLHLLVETRIASKLTYLNVKAYWFLLRMAVVNSNVNFCQGSLILPHRCSDKQIHIVPGHKITVFVVWCNECKFRPSIR